MYLVSAQLAGRPLAAFRILTLLCASHKAVLLAMKRPTARSPGSMKKPKVELHESLEDEAEDEAER